ncbi:uncharacterized protein DUF563 [Kineococcus rhizosphaerae]|uniref:Uncharacterized protein DUF563 n=1 Tax=Kineococcus rhizosphaerae TaxID=559628 RepID=A0A2T0R0W1_9ACTN|nr:uncharacterized protein DUF563 [Kineococcus rhizosphaerae]
MARFSFVDGRVGWRYLAVSAGAHQVRAVQRFARGVRHATVPGVRARALAGPGIRYHAAEAGHEVRLTVPGEFDAADRRAIRQRDVTSVPEQFVLELPRATLTGREGWVFHDGRLVEDLWQEAGFPARSLLPPSRSLRPPVHLPGTTVSLLMPWSPNYYHWTVQTVPRVLHVRRALGGSLDDVDQWLVPGRAPAFVAQWLDLLGVPASRRVEVVDADAQFSTDRLVVSSVPGRNRWVSAPTVDLVRRAALPVPPTGTGRRLLLHRDGQVRRLLNADAVLEALARRGFEVVDPAALSITEEARTFAEADIVVGVHGAGLTNLVFCRPGASVVELTPRSLVYPTFAKLALAAGVRHRVVVGSEPRLPWPLRFPDTHADLLVDVSRLLAAVESELARLAHSC